MKAQPNFLIFITDQHRPDHTGFGGNEIVRTPNLDQLAGRSMVFDRAIVANPICMPNRSSIFTGRVPSVHRTRYNGIPLDWCVNTFPRALRRRGYHTASFGKLHLQNMGNNRPVVEAIFRDAPESDAVDSPYPDGWDLWENGDRHTRERVELPPDFYGLDEVDLVIEHSDLCTGHYYQWLLEQGVKPETLQGPQVGLPYDAQTSQVWRTRMPEELYPTRYISQQTAAFLERYDRKTPFVAFCSYPDPHHPFTPPGRYFDMYDPESIPLPATWSDPHTNSPRHYKTRLRYRGSQQMLMQPFSPTEEQFREMAAAEYGMITMVDDGIGEVLAALERAGLADDTVIIFTSDHGDMFGDHSMMLKASMHYEGCLRVPLTISVPGKAPGRTRSLASSLDLAQTILELAGAPEYHGMQGASLLPVLDDPKARVRDHVYVEEDEMFDLARVGGPLRMRTLLREDARFTIYRGTDEGELFALNTDPDEMTNLYGAASARDLRADCTEELARRLMEYADPAPLPSYMA